MFIRHLIKEIKTMKQVIAEDIFDGKIKSEVDFRKSLELLITKIHWPRLN
jgi:hypothetical protein